MKYQSPKGTRDLLPAELARWRAVEEAARRTARLYGYGEIRTPTFEQVELFARAVGDATDIVEKEMYVFDTAGGDRFALRPEATASVCRAYIEHGLHRTDPFQKFWYAGPMFRHDRPQAGRYREFRQFGVEAIGWTGPDIDAEVVALGAEVIAGAGVKGVRVKLNSIGCNSPDCRPAFREKLKQYLAERESRLCGDCRGRLQKNVMRILDCKVPTCRKVAAEAPKPADNLCGACAEHFSTVRESLKGLKVSFEVDPMIVRGLDYYTRTVFEYFVTGAEGSQDALGAGGRYDGLIELIGGPATPGIGFALGLDRIVERASGGATAEAAGVDVYVIPQSREQMADASACATIFRREGSATALAYGDRSFKAHMRMADRSGADHAIIIGPDEAARGVVQVKSLKEKSEQIEVKRENLAEWAREYALKRKEKKA